MHYSALFLLFDVLYQKDISCEISAVYERRMVLQWQENEAA